MKKIAVMEDPNNRVLDIFQKVELWKQFRRGEEMVLFQAKPKEPEKDAYTEYHCHQCGFNMKIPVRKDAPKQCHVCGSSYWNDPDHIVGRYLTESQKRHRNLLRGMVDRCYNPKSDVYYNYGARGIKVSPLWYDENLHRYHDRTFSEWCEANGWAPGLQIDRIDNCKGYSPENCRFVTGKENLRNRRTNIYVTVDGVSKCVGEWCETCGMNYYVLLHRIHRGWDPKRAMLIPEDWNRPHLCFHKSLNGKSCRRTGGRLKCCASSDDGMRMCPFFYEYKRGDEIPVPLVKRRRSSYQHFKKMKDARIGL